MLQKYSVIIVTLLICGLVLTEVVPQGVIKSTSDWLSSQDWLVHQTWYNSSPVFRDRISIIFYLVLAGCLISFISAFFVRHDKLFGQMSDLSAFKILLGFMFLSVCLTVLIFMPGKKTVLTVSDISSFKLAFLHNSIHGLAILQYLCLQLSFFLGAYTKYVLSMFGRNMSKSDTS